MQNAEVERLSCAVLTGEPAAWNPRDPAEVGAFLDTCRYHGVLPLLDAAFRSRDDLGTWPEEIRVACRQATLAQTGYELVHGAEIERVLAALARRGIKSLLLKGTGLAYSLYPSPALRPRADTDLLVSPEMRDTAWQILQSQGYVRISGPAGRFVGYQLQIQRRDALGLVHNLDLHWRISNTQSFAWLLSFPQLAATALPVPELDPRALRLGNVHALLLCLLHRSGNNAFMERGFGDRLIWLYDIHLLVGAMVPTERDEFRASVERHRVGAITLEGLRRCAEWFPSPALAELIDAVAAGPHARSGAEVLGDGRLHREWVELRAIPNAASRVAYLAERAFPSREYMRERYPEASATALPRLHAQRWLEGLGKLVNARRRGD